MQMMRCVFVTRAFFVHTMRALITAESRWSGLSRGAIAQIHQPRVCHCQESHWE